MKNNTTGFILIEHTTHTCIPQLSLGISGRKQQARARHRLHPGSTGLPAHKLGSHFEGLFLVLGLFSTRRSEGKKEKRKKKKKENETHLGHHYMLRNPLGTADGQFSLQEIKIEETQTHNKKKEKKNKKTKKTSVSASDLICRSLRGLRRLFFFFFPEAVLLEPPGASHKVPVVDRVSSFCSSSSDDEKAFSSMILHPTRFSRFLIIYYFF
jgi:hypothetical protein